MGSCGPCSPAVQAVGVSARASRSLSPPSHKEGAGFHGALSWLLRPVTLHGRPNPCRSRGDAAPKGRTFLGSVPSPSWKAQGHGSGGKGLEGNHCPGLRQPSPIPLPEPLPRTSVRPAADSCGKGPNIMLEVSNAFCEPGMWTHTSHPSGT